VTLFTATIDPLQSISMDLSEPCKIAADQAIERILAELHDAAILVLNCDLGFELRSWF
jgi:hypothetical protein